MNCAGCGKGPLSRDEIGLTKKLVNRGSVSCFCLDCLAARFRTSRKELLDIAARFRESGCTLFR